MTSINEVNQRTEFSKKTKSIAKSMNTVINKMEHQAKEMPPFYQKKYLENINQLRKRTEKLISLIK